MEFLVVLVVLVVVVLVISAPLRHGAEGRGRPAADPGEAAPAYAGNELAELQAAREAKYREIRDAELDRATGKLSDEDHRAMDARLRAEALEILRAIDRLPAPR